MSKKFFFILYCFAQGLSALNVTATSTSQEHHEPEENREEVFKHLLFRNPFDVAKHAFLQTTHFTTDLLHHNIIKAAEALEIEKRQQAEAVEKARLAAQQAARFNAAKGSSSQPQRSSSQEDQALKEKRAFLERYRAVLEKHPANFNNKTHKDAWTAFFDAKTISDMKKYEHDADFAPMRGTHASWNDANQPPKKPSKR